MRLGEDLQSFSLSGDLPVSSDFPRNFRTFNGCFNGKRRECREKSRDFIDDTLQYINRHLTEDLTLERLAKRVSLSPFYFSRRFKQETGYTPYHYIYTSRIHLARFYLKTSEDTVKEIGYRCGFKSEHSFCTAFKNEMGQTPTEFREG